MKKMMNKKAKGMAKGGKRGGARMMMAGGGKAKGGGKATGGGPGAGIVERSQ